MLHRIWSHSVSFENASSFYLAEITKLCFLVTVLVVVRKLNLRLFLTDHMQKKTLSHAKRRDATLTFGIRRIMKKKATC